MGQLQARVADEHSLVNVHINGNFSVACLHNMRGETTLYENFKAWNSNTSASAYDVVLDGLNHFNVQSLYSPQTNPVDGTAGGFHQQVFINPDLRESGGGHALWMASASGFRFYGGYMATAGGVTPVVIYGGLASGTGLTNEAAFDLHMETNPTSAFLITGADATPAINGIVYCESGSEITGPVFALDTGITSVVVNQAEIFVAGRQNPANAKLVDTLSK